MALSVGFEGSPLASWQCSMQWKSHIRILDSLVDDGGVPWTLPTNRAHVRGRHRHEFRHAAARQRRPRRDHRTRVAPHVAELAAVGSITRTRNGRRNGHMINAGAALADPVAHERKMSAAADGAGPYAAANPLDIGCSDPGAWTPPSRVHRPEHRQRARRARRLRATTLLGPFLYTETSTTPRSPSHQPVPQRALWRSSLDPPGSCHNGTLSGPSARPTGGVDRARGAEPGGREGQGQRPPDPVERRRMAS